MFISHREGHVRVEVEDKGKGISPQKRSEIISSPAAIPGVGIRGMRERLRQLGGTLEVQSQGEGKGMTVTAVLPVEVASEPVQARSATASSLEASA